MERIPIDKGEPDAELVARAAAAIRGGQTVVLPTETVYGLAADPRHHDSVARAREVKGRAEGHHFTHHLSGAAEVEAFARAPSRRTSRLLSRYWPGPLTVVLEARDGGTVGLRVPGSRFTRAVITAVGDSLYLTSVNPTGEPPVLEPDEIAARFGDRIDLLFDAGPPPLGQSSTVVRCVGDVFEVLREGALTRDEVLRAAASLVVFVCTGNTCRSPLAEAIARRRFADRFEIEPEQLLARGLDLASAGISTLAGMPASAGSLEVAAERGLDVTGHRSMPLTAELVEHAVRIYGMTESHCDAILSRFPDAAIKVELLGADDIADPFGGDTEEYRRARDEIERGIEMQLDRVSLLVD